MIFTIDQNLLSRFSETEKCDIARATDFVNYAHRHQLRQEGVPFIVHLVRVAEMVCSWGCDADTVVAALLHDVVEDTEVTLEEVNASFGAKVAKLVDGATKVENPVRTVADRLTQEKISKLFVTDKRIAYVKLADRIHNLSTLSHLEEHRQKRILAESLYFYLPLAAKLGDKNIIQDLDSMIRQYRDLV